MATNKKNKKASEIDEELMMNLMVDGIKEEGLRLPKEPMNKSSETKNMDSQALKKKSSTPKKAKSRNTVKADYEAIFFKNPDTNARDGKTVYIRPEFHEKLSRIAQVIGDNKLSIYAYLDNVLEYHFEEFGEQIIKSFNDKYKPIL
ncbi:MAG TPA: DUF3408 domain-containing protein [Chitinophagaceae bacterium]|nr:DUF3408 domain-containing protein [Chitinophagaceae bacterium]